MSNNKTKKVYVKDYLSIFKMELEQNRFGWINAVKENALIAFLEELDPNSTLTFKVKT